MSIGVPDSLSSMVQSFHGIVADPVNQFFTNRFRFSVAPCNMGSVEVTNQVEFLVLYAWLDIRWCPRQSFVRSVDVAEDTIL